jgi:uncharacterized membrane protein (UPF0127 family)
LQVGFAVVPIHSRLASLAVALCLTAMVACQADLQACRDDPGAKVHSEHLELRVGERTYEAEVARTKSDRERGWGRRRCGREALLLVPDARAPLPVWGCHLVEPVQAALIRDGAIVDVAARIDPCAAPCTGCPIFGEAVDVDGVLELPLGVPAPRVGERVEGVPRAADG